MTDPSPTPRRRLIGRGLRYLIVGGSNTLVSYAVFIGLSFLIPTWLAYTVAFALGLAWTVFASARFVFRANPSIRRMLLFAALYLFIYGCGQLVIRLIDPHGLVPLLITSLVVLAITTPLSFFGAALIFDRPLTRRSPPDERRPDIP